MSFHERPRHDIQLYSRDAIARPGPVPRSRLENLLQVRAHKALFARKPSPTVSLFGTTSCAPGDNSGACEKPVDATSNTTIPIVLFENQRLDARFKTVAASGGRPKFSASGLGRHGRQPPFELRLPFPDERLW